jgi:hypothetical protein
MSKDFAFMFYPGEYLRDTQCLSEKSQVAYDRIMCEHMRNICISKAQLNFFTKKLSPDELSELMFMLNKINGGYEIEWVAKSIRERNAYSESRRKNREGKSREDITDISDTYDKHMVGKDKSEDEDLISIKELQNCFEIFRQNYPGTKRGFDPEFENLKKKHKTWKEIIPLLSDALNYQLSARELKRLSGGFVPEWKNLQTWINQKCWLEEIEINNISNGTNQKHSGATNEQLASLLAAKLGTDAVK